MITVLPLNQSDVVKFVQFLAYTNDTHSKRVWMYLLHASDLYRFEFENNESSV